MFKFPFKRLKNLVSKSSFKQKSRWLMIIFIIVIAGLFLSLRPQKINRTDEKQHLPRIITRGNQIIREDTGEEVRLRGATSMAFVRYDYEIDEFLEILKAVKDWGINVLGFYVDSDLIGEKYDQLDQVVIWAEENEIYVYLVPFLVDQPSDVNVTLREKIEELGDLAEFFAERYLNNSNVIFGLWAEPRRVLWREWVEIAKGMIERIRAKNPEALILMSGVAFGRRFYLEEASLDFENIIYDIHSYPWADEEEAGKEARSEEDLYPWRKLVKEHPVLIGEFGGVHKDDFSGKTDIWYIEKVLEDINQYGLSYTAYTIDEEGGLGLINWETKQPTVKGKVILDDLKDFPPTKF